VERVRLLEGEAIDQLPALAGGAPITAPVTIRLAVNADSLATWLMPALAAFIRKTGAMIDLVVEGEGQTAERLKSGEVLAAITADPVPVQGCRILPIGALRYAATASPAFAQHYFPHGAEAAAIARAPVLRFGRDDNLQLRWARAAGAEISARSTSVPTTQGFIDAVLAGLGWAMNPLRLVQPHLAAGRLVELLPGRFLDVTLYWQHARLGKTLLNSLTREIESAAKRELL
jgi:LysR family transcriptional regulator (chromosome initiation inhibitor)